MTDTNTDSAHLIPAAAKLRRSRFRWRLFAFLALLIAILAVAGRFAMVSGAGTDQIARVVISGVIASDPTRLKILQDLAKDDHVKAVIVSINSPGGTTAGGEELYEALGQLRAKKPVVAVIAELGASAAYMTAIATDRIFARRLSIVGSIGVLFQTYNAAKLMDTIGIASDKVASGPLKAEPDIDKPMSPEVRASLQSLINDSFNWFVDIVAERRNLPRPDVLTLADGRILTGRQGLDSRLIDAVGGEKEAIGWLESDKGIKADLPVVTSFPLPENPWSGVGRWVGGQARTALGLSPDGPIALDGLVSLWQVGPSL